MIGRARTEQWREHEGRLCVDLGPCESRGLRHGERAALALTIRGYSYKTMGCELSTSTWRARSLTLRALAQLGVPTRLHVVWLGTALLGHSRGPVRITHGAVSGGSATDGTLTVEVALCPEVRLTPAERRVAFGVALGLSDATIARMRACSKRTVANQVRALGVKLGASGRPEIVRGLLRGSGDGLRAPSAPSP